MFRGKSPSIKTKNSEEQVKELANAKTAHPIDVPEEAISDSANVKNSDPTIPRTSTLKKLSKQLSKIPFRRRALTKDSDSESKNESVLPTDRVNRRSVSNKSTKNENIILEANGTQENSFDISLVGGDAFDEEVRSYLKNVLSKQNEKYALLEMKLNEKENALVESKKLYDAVIAQIFLLEERLSNEDDLRLKNDSLEQQIYGLENEKDRLETKFDRVYELLTSVTGNADNMLELTSLINQIKESQLIIEDTLKHARKRSPQTQSDIYENLSAIKDQPFVPQSLSDKDNRLQEAEKAYLDLKEEFDIIQRKSDETENASRLLTADKLQAQKRIAELEAAVNYEVATRKNLEAENKHLEKNAEDFKRQLKYSNQEMEEVKLANGKHLGEIVNLKKEIVKFVEIIQDKNNTIEILEKESKSYQCIKAHMELEILDLRQKAQSAEETIKEIEISKKSLLENDRLKTENKSLHFELQKIKNNNLSIENENSGLKTEIMRLEKYQLELVAENQNLNLEFSQFKNNVHENEMEKLREKISSLTADNLHLREELKKSDSKNLISAEVGNEKLEKLTQSLIREKSIIEYAFGAFKAQVNLKEKEFENINKNLTELLLSTERQLADANMKANHLLVLNEELEQKVRKEEGLHKEPEEKLVHLLAAVESRLNSAMIDIIICQENLETALADRDKKALLLDESKKIVSALEETNTRLKGDIQSLKEELFSCKLNYRDEIEKLTSQIIELGGSASSVYSIEKLAGINSINSMMHDQLAPLIDDENLRIPIEIKVTNLISIGMNIVEIVKYLTSRSSIVDINQSLSKLWKDMVSVQSGMLENCRAFSEKSSLTSVFPEDAPSQMAPQNSVDFSILDKSESEDSVILSAPENSVVLAETDYSNLKTEIKKKDLEINFFTGGIAMQALDSVIKDLNNAIEHKMKQEPADSIQSLGAKLHEASHALKSLDSSERNNLADQSHLLVSNSIAGLGEFRESLEYAQKIGDLELQHALDTQKLKDEIKDLNIQLEKYSQKSIHESSTGKLSTGEMELEKTLMASKTDLFNSKLQEKSSEKEISALNSQITEFEAAPSLGLPFHID